MMLCANFLYEILNYLMTLLLIECGDFFKKGRGTYVGTSAISMGQRNA